MASQQSLIAETIRGMKLALKRKDTDSDSDTSIQEHTNRGNKRKRRARYVRDGRLDDTGGQAYKKQIEHAGYTRTIIHERPPIFDADGDLVDPDEDHDPDFCSPAEDDPFEETKLEDLLMPLTSPMDLANHPALSVPYTSQHITEMAENARKMVHRERETLWRLKKFLQTLRGDEDWAPLENFETANDEALLDADVLENDREDKSIAGSALAAPPSIENGNINAGLLAAAAYTNGGSKSEANTEVARMNGVEATDMAARTNGTHHDESSAQVNGVDATNTIDAEPAQNHDAMDTTADTELNGTASDTDAPVAHAMTTRAKARTPPPSDGQSLPYSDAPSSLPSIAAFFLQPASSLPDQTLGLPEREADDLRRLLLLYVQKQEEVVRGTDALLHGLLRADRLRADVWGWCKAEGHVGELSDGEDWYDKDEWGLDKDLIKGKEEQEEEDESKKRNARVRRVGGARA